MYLSYSRQSFSQISVYQLFSDLSQVIKITPHVANLQLLQPTWATNTKFVRNKKINMCGHPTVLESLAGRLTELSASDSIEFSFHFRFL